MNYIDRNTLEKTGFYYVLDRLSICCVYTADILYDLKPLKEKDELLLEYKNVEECLPAAGDGIVMNNFRSILGRFKDIRNTFTRCGDGNILDEVELYEIKYFVQLHSEIKELYENCGLDIHGAAFHDFSGIYNLLNPVKSRTSGFHIYDEYSLELKNTRCSKKKFDKMIFREKDARKQRELFERRQELAEREKNLEFQIREKLSFSISENADRLMLAALSLGRLDIALAKAKLALDYDMCPPGISGIERIYMRNAVNPMIKDEVTKRGGMFCPISIDVQNGTTVITGANMGGKTVVLRTILLNYIMAVMGFYTFSDCFQFWPLDFVVFLREDMESVRNGLSSFGGEVLALKKVLDRIKSESGLIVVDEFARGTNPVEGSNIAKALVCYMNRFNSISIISTHYDGVCRFAGFHYQIKGLKNVDFRRLKESGTDGEAYLKSISESMDYTLEKVDGDTPVPRDAINICRLMGIDDEIINIAEKLYGEEEKNER
ncbi:MAG: hypothetical protein LKE46_08910 [Clostridium sp.]|jgi:dsDNA-specific endonuclease/ATPase MutS2|uniref:lysine 5,6-aminomutase reactivase ATPase KamC n=1 Tax=Clostridium sp. TaxID=1506 RepID=UPI0025C475ED|nr:hypothetical protein [Clostridium sp.]MCH3964386.1 hypothetical protein [Clostridium sp.]MCI1715561.1 hypothetical protein [Clostridium sp.]MCI1799647.1 hypothetical protein [Clostridium sp.]MCI1813745.1 hypothetical protein [Clostridium sp.]MCI1870460.1 hypothetical protein [Clostridium sp.]